MTASAPSPPAVAQPNASSAAGPGAAAASGSAPPNASGLPPKTKSRSNILSSQQRLAKSKSRSLGSTFSLVVTSPSRANLAAIAASPPTTLAGGEDVQEDPAAREEREQREMIEEYQKRLEQLPLPADMLKRGLSQMGPSADGLKQVYQKLSIPFAGLNNIAALRDYPYIQNLELRGNNITDVSALGSMRYLVQLDLSSNRLTEVLAFDPPPFDLQQVDLSRNQITMIRDLSEHRFLSSLNLDRNLIKTVTGLSQCRHLKHLSLAHNGITRVDALSNLPLRTLDLQSNRIVSLQGIETLKDLQEVRLAHNFITSIHELRDHPALRYMDVESNQLTQLEQVQMLDTLPHLRELRLRKNPLANLPAATWLPTNKAIPMHSTAQYPPSYRLRSVYLLQRLTVLDGLPVTPEEKVAAVNAYEPPQDVVVSVQHAHLQKKQAWAYARIKAEDLMRAKRLRPVVLCGPNGAGKRTLTSRLLQEFPHIYGLSISHTTRRPRPGEENGVHYYFVSRDEMEKMNEDGKFIEVVTLFGNMYGTSMEAVDKVTEEGKICIMDLEIEGVMALRKSHLKPRYIYVTTPNMAVLQQRLQSRMTPQSRGSGVKPDGFGKLPPTKEEGVAEAAGTGQGDSKDSGGDVSSWLTKARHTITDYDSSLFDFTLVNDELERAYAELKAYCMRVYWADFEDDD
ncbi:hypothetical protein BC831DRAFT_415235 [Entophlyctis helioformis]|nr:hypothetical protein BC831DRAFT_415235 [Entophlyctis helioformis]